MFFQVFSIVVWMIAASTIAFSISVFDGYRYTSLIIFFFSIFIFLFPVTVFKQVRDNASLIVCLFLYGVGLIIFQYLDGSGVLDFSLPSRFFIVIPVLMLLLYINDYKILLLFGSAVGAITGFIWAYHEVFDLNAPRANGGLVSIMFGNVAVILASLSLVAFFYFIKKGNLYISLLFLLSIIFGVGASLLSGSRGGWVAIVFVFLFVFFQNRNFFIGNIKIACVLFGGAFVLLALLVPYTNFLHRTDVVIDEVVHYFGGGAKGSSSGVRFEMWKMSYYMFEDHPIFGVGRESSVEFKKALVEEGKVTQLATTFGHAHNAFFDALGYRGLVGLLLEIMIYLVPFYLFYRKNKEYKDNWDVRVYALSGCTIPLVYIFAGLTEVLFAHKIGVTMYTFLVVFFWAAVRLAEKEHVANKELVSL